MRLILAAGLAALITGAPATAAVSPQARHCADLASGQGLRGARAAAFKKKCLAGPLASSRPTAPVGPSEGARAVVAPSGADRTVRTRECEAAADKRRLTGQGRKQFQLSCLATAGPTGEAENQTLAPKHAPAIKGIGINNYNRPPGAPVNRPPPQ